VFSKANTNRANRDVFALAGALAPLTTRPLTTRPRAALTTRLHNNHKLDGCKYQSPDLTKHGGNGK